MIYKKNTNLTKLVKSEVKVLGCRLMNINNKIQSSWQVVVIDVFSEEKYITPWPIGMRKCQDARRNMKYQEQAECNIKRLFSLSMKR